MDTISPLRFMVPPQNVMSSQDPLQGLASSKFMQPADLQQLQQMPQLQQLQQIPQLTPAASSDTPLAVSQTDTGSSTSFQNMLGNFVDEVSQKQATASDAVNGLLSGKNVSLHQAVISMEEASVSFQMMVEVRNKLLDSYQEIMRM